MKGLQLKAKRYDQRNRRVKAKIFGTESRPRLVVFRSNVHIYAQIINDDKGITLVASSDMKLKKEGKVTKSQVASLVGESLAKDALKKKIKLVVFDRNGFAYHGRVKALADGARKGGLEF